MSSIRFNASSFAPVAAAALLKPGDYDARIMQSEIMPVRSGDGRAIQVAFEMLSPEHEGRIVWSRIHFETQDRLVRDIASRELAALCKAVGVSELTDTEQLLHKCLRVTLGIKPRRDGDMTNVVRAYLPLPSQSLV